MPSDISCALNNKHEFKKVDVSLYNVSVYLEEEKKELLTVGTTTDEIVKIYQMGEGPPEVTTNEPSTPCGEPSIGSGNFSTTNKSY